VCLKNTEGPATPILFLLIVVLRLRKKSEVAVYLQKTSSVFFSEKKWPTNRDSIAFSRVLSHSLSGLFECIHHEAYSFLMLSLASNQDFDTCPHPLSVLSQCVDAPCVEENLGFYRHGRKF